MDDYTREWINFLRSKADDLEKSLPKPERYLTSSVITIIIGGVAAVAGWFGRLDGLGVKLIVVIGIVIIILMVGLLLGYIYLRLQSEQKRISKEKDNILILIAMILGKMITNPEEIYNYWRIVSAEDAKKVFAQLDDPDQIKYIECLKKQGKEWENFEAIRRTDRELESQQDSD